MGEGIFKCLFSEMSVFGMGMSMRVRVFPDIR